MAKYQNDLMLDAALDYVATGVLMIACSTQPTNYTEATATYALADVVMTSGDYTKANGDSSGRKLVVGAKNAVNVDITGTFGHVAIVSADTLLYVTTGTGQELTSGNTVNFPAWDIELADAA